MEKGFVTPLRRTEEMAGVVKGVSNPFSILEGFREDYVGGEFGGREACNSGCSSFLRGNGLGGIDRASG